MILLIRLMSINYLSIIAFSRFERVRVPISVDTIPKQLVQIIQIMMDRTISTTKLPAQIIQMHNYFLSLILIETGCGLYIRRPSKPLLSTPTRECISSLTIYYPLTSITLMEWNWINIHITQIMVGPKHIK